VSGHRPMTAKDRIGCIRPKVRRSYQERFIPRNVRQGQGNALVDLILLPETFVFGRYRTVSISPPFDIACPRPEATIPIGQVQRSVLKRDSTSLKINHLDGISITHWPKEGEPACHRQEW
jgi:hypothetical protein